MPFIGKSREQLQKENVTNIKSQVEKDAWISIKRYFDGAGNGPEAKVAAVVITTLAREQQAKNNSRQLDIIELRLLNSHPKP